MPIYEYQCEQCSKRTEAIQRLDEPPLEICPHCGGELRKLMSAPAFQFKGSGWYVTDYADKGRKDIGGSKGRSDAKGKATDSGGESKDSAKGDSSDATSSS